MRYYNIDGVDYPSVTTILSALPTPIALKLFIENNPNAKQIAAERAYIGVMAHYYFECQNSIPLNREAILEEVDKQFDTEKLDDGSRERYFEMYMTNKSQNRDAMKILQFYNYL